MAVRLLCFALLIVGMQFLSGCANRQSSAAEILEESGRTQYNLYFYPSTLRMLHVEKDTAWNNMVGEIHHLHVLVYGDGAMPDSSLAAAKTQLQRSGYEDIFTLQNDTARINLYGKFDEDKMKSLFGLILTSHQGYVVDLDGSVSPFALVNFFQNGADLGVLTNFFDQEDRNAQRIQRYRDINREMYKEDSVRRVQDSLRLNTIK